MFQKIMEPFDPAEGEVKQEDSKQDTLAENSDSEEAARPRTRAPPVKPSAAEVENHMVTHLPFRDWCPHCVRGKSGSKVHKANPGKHEIPTIAVDYMFMHSRQEESEERGMPIMVTKDLMNCETSTGMVSASVVTQKGMCPQAIRRLSSEIGKLGHSELILKSDGEPSIMTLKQLSLIHI